MSKTMSPLSSVQLAQIQDLKLFFNCVGEIVLTDSVIKPKSMLFVLPDECCQQILSFVAAGDDTKASACSLSMLQLTSGSLTSVTKAFVKSKDMAAVCKHAGLLAPISGESICEVFAFRSAQLRERRRDPDLIYNQTQASQDVLFEDDQAGFGFSDCFDVTSTTPEALSEMRSVPASWHRSLYWFEKFAPRRAFLPHARENPLLAISSGGELQSTAVGGNYRFLTAAQLPPSPGDHFCHTFYLAKGSYSAAVRGGTNPMHGKMKLLLDGQVIEAEQDWSSDVTSFPVTQYVHDVVVKTSGRHRLEGIVSAGERGSWMCLTEFVFRRTDVQQEIGQAHAEAFGGCGPICERIMTSLDSSGDGLLSSREIAQALTLLMQSEALSPQITRDWFPGGKLFIPDNELFHLARFYVVDNFSPASVGPILIKYMDYLPALVSTLANRNMRRY